MKAGQLIKDGSVTWIVDDVRDGARVGDIILRPTLRDGYVKANGATVKASEYPRLLAWVQESNMTVTAEEYKTNCGKYVYDEAADTLILPNVTGRVLQGGESVKSVEAGLPNITGKYQDNGFDNEAVAFGAFAKGEDIIKNFSVHSDKHFAGASSIDLDASRSSAVYGKSDTVQPPVITLIAQIKY